jgi:hypothetical protein
MNLAELSYAVTDAIIRAEALKPGSWEAEAAFREVSDLEQAIAATAGANDVEGEIARVGAVSAALSAREALRAVQLADLYLHDDLSDGARAKLDELRAQAEAEISAAEEPTVFPVSFQLKPAA